MKYTCIFLILLFSIASCTSSAQSGEQSSENQAPPGQVEQTDPLLNKGIGPITSLTLGEIDTEMAEAGRKTYNSMCSACHQIEQDYIGPSPKGIFERRSPEWIMNMILNPVEMLEKDPIAIKLLEEANGVPMANQGLTEEEARSILEYFRTL